MLLGHESIVYSSDKNVMEFFLEYDKHNKENKVRIYTDFGNIDIELFQILVVI